MRLTKTNQYQPFRCDGCGGVAQFLNDRDLTRRRWSATKDGRHYCPLPECKRKAVGEVVPEKVSAYDLVRVMDEVYDAHKGPFSAAFGRPLSRYWDRVMGFDVVRFDEEVAHSGDRTMADAVRLRYGVVGASIVKTIIASEKRAVDELGKIGYNARIPAE